MFRVRAALSILIALLALAAPATAAATPSRLAPWPDAPPPGASPVKREPEASPLKLPLLGALWVYRNVISPVDGSRCNLYPTCSAYATQAVRRHGPLIGGWLAADRLLHEASVRPPEYPIVEKFGRRWIADPLDENDEIFRRKSPAKAPPAPEPAILPAASARGTGIDASLSDPALAARQGLDFAERGESYRAVNELRRAAYLSRDPARASVFLAEAGWVAAGTASRFRVAAMGERDAGRAAFEEADRLFEDAERAAQAAQDRTLERRASFGRAATFLARGWSQEAHYRLAEVAVEKDSSEPVVTRDAAWLSAWAVFSADLEEGESAKKAAGRAFEPLTSDADRGQDARALIAEAGRVRFRTRSPQVAMMLGLALPGAGHVYAGKPLLGLGSFLLNAAFIGGIVLAIQDGNYPLAATLLSLETGWYIGGAGGAAQAVVERNDRGRWRLERGLRKKFMGTIWPGGAAARISF